MKTLSSLVNLYSSYFYPELYTLFKRHSLTSNGNILNVSPDVSYIFTKFWLYNLFFNWLISG